LAEPLVAYASYKHSFILVNELKVKKNMVIRYLLIFQNKIGDEIHNSGEGGEFTKLSVTRNTKFDGGILPAVPLKQ